MKVKNIIKKGTITVTEHYNQTMTSSGDTLVHELDVPQALQTLAENETAIVTTHGDQTNGIEIDGRLWAHPSGMGEYGGFEGDVKRLNKKVWNYIYAAQGRHDFINFA